MVNRNQYTCNTFSFASFIVVEKSLAGYKNQKNKPKGGCYKRNSNCFCLLRIGDSYNEIKDCIDVANWDEMHD